MLRCGAADAAQCLKTHYRPHLLPSARLAADGLSLRALAPCHDDRAPSLTISVMDDGHISFNCFACAAMLGRKEARKATRNALIKAGVPRVCLPQPKADAEAQLAAIESITEGKDTPASKVLQIMALLHGWEKLPGGGDLEVVAEACGIAPSTAYALRRSLQPR